MPETLKKVAFVGLALAIAAGVSGCGRKGNLERPGTYEGQKMDSSGKPVGPDKPFILDPLL